MRQEDYFELLVYMITSAAGLKGEPKIYGPLRMIEASERLCSLMLKEDPDNPDLKELRDEYESAIITEALRQTHRLNAAAEKLSMSPQKLQYRLERLGLKENQKNLIK